MPGTAMPAQRASVVALTYFLSAQVYLTRRGQAQGRAALGSCGRVGVAADYRRAAPATP